MRQNKQNETDYSLYNKILDLTTYVKTYIASSIPCNNRDIRIHLLDEIYMLSKNMFYATYTKGSIRIKHLVDIQVNLSLIDMQMSELRDIKSVSNKSLDVAISKLSSIKNIIYAWKFNEESKKNEKNI